MGLLTDKTQNYKCSPINKGQGKFQHKFQLESVSNRVTIHSLVNIVISVGMLTFKTQNYKFSLINMEQV